MTRLEQAQADLDAARERVFAQDRGIAAAATKGDFDQAARMRDIRVQLVQGADKAQARYDEASAEAEAEAASPNAISAGDRNTKSAFARLAKAGDAVQAWATDGHNVLAEFDAAVQEASNEFGVNPRLREDVRTRLQAPVLVRTEMARLGLPGGVADLVSAGADNPRQLKPLGHAIRELLKAAWTAN